MADKLQDGEDDTPEEMLPVADDLRPWQRILASSVGGLITSLMTTPLDVVKIRLQAQAKPLVHGECYIYSSGLTDHLCVHCGAKTIPLCRPGVNHSARYTGTWVRSGNLRTMCFHSGRGCLSPVSHGMTEPFNSLTTRRTHGNNVTLQCLLSEGTRGVSSKTYYKGSVDAGIQIVRNEGLPALWSGLPPTLVMALPGTIIYYTLYDIIKEQLGFNLYAKGEKATSQAWIPSVTGAVARTAAVMILSPLELARTKVQSESLSYSAIFKSLRESVVTRGFRSLWLGAGPTLLRDVPFSAFYWGSFDAMKQQVLCRKMADGNKDSWVDGQPRLTFSESFMMGAVAGGVAAVATLPFDVIKTHRQIELGEAVFSKRRAAASSTWKSIADLYQTRGPRVLYTGLVPRLVKVIPACAIMISSFEYMKTHFVKMNSR